MNFADPLKSLRLFRINVVQQQQPPLTHMMSTKSMNPNKTMMVISNISKTFVNISKN